MTRVAPGERGGQYTSVTDRPSNSRHGPRDQPGLSRCSSEHFSPTPSRSKTRSPSQNPLDTASADDISVTSASHPQTWASTSSRRRTARASRSAPIGCTIARSTSDVVAVHGNPVQVVVLPKMPTRQPTGTTSATTDLTTLRRHVVEKSVTVVVHRTEKFGRAEQPHPQVAAVLLRLGRVPVVAHRRHDAVREH